jgi:hypothetical protein
MQVVLPQVTHMKTQRKLKQLSMTIDGITGGLGLSMEHATN